MGVGRGGQYHACMAGTDGNEADKLWAELGGGGGGDGGEAVRGGAGGGGGTSKVGKAAGDGFAGDPGARVGGVDVDGAGAVDAAAGALFGKRAVGSRSTGGSAAAFGGGGASGEASGEAVRVAGSGGRSWPLVAVIAGGVVLLALVVMVGVYVLSSRAKPAMGAGGASGNVVAGPSGNVANNESVTGKSGAGRGGGVDASRAGKININTASATELALLPGVGPSLAAAIVTYRVKHGRFASVAALDSVPGIGPKRLAEITPLAFVD